MESKISHGFLVAGFDAHMNSACEDALWVIRCWPVTYKTVADAGDDMAADM